MSKKRYMVVYQFKSKSTGGTGLGRVDGMFSNPPKLEEIENAEDTIRNFKDVADCIIVNLYEIAGEIS